MTTNFPGNRDGKLLDRMVAGILSAVLTAGCVALVFWKDTAVADGRTIAAINRIDKEIAGIKMEQTDLRRSTENDRRVSASLAGDVKVLLAITQRVEKAVDRLTEPPRRN